MIDARCFTAGRCTAGCGEVDEAADSPEDSGLNDVLLVRH